MKNKLKRAALSLMYVASVTTYATSAQAGELWDVHLRGLFEGTPAGALPPPGVYGVLDNYWADWTAHDAQGNKIPGTHINALIVSPTVIWVPGFSVLGATFGMALNQSFDYNSGQAVQSQYPGAGNLGTYNTVFVPAMLSWKLPQHVFVRASVAWYVDDGTSTPPDMLEGNLKNGGNPSADGFTSIEPALGLSWLNNGWNISVLSSVAFPLTSDHVGSPVVYRGQSLPYYTYRTGPQFAADYTITKTIGFWTVGLGGESLIQLTKDTLDGQHVPSSINRDYGFGPIVGYQWRNGFSVTALWNHQFGTASEVGGDFFDVRFAAPL